MEFKGRNRVQRTLLNASGSSDICTEADSINFRKCSVRQILGYAKSSNSIELYFSIEGSPNCAKVEEIVEAKAGQSKVLRNH